MGIHNIWQEYGFSRNPYHTVHLGVSEDDSKLYVNRELLEGQLGSFLLSEDRGAIFVEGPVGVGKTSFVNQTQYLIMKQHNSAILPAQRVVEVQNKSTATDILFSILGGVLRSLAALSPDCVKKKRYAEVETYLRKTHIISWNASAGIAGFGGGVSRTKTPTEPVTVPLQTIQSLFEETTRMAAEEGFKKITVLINNLDNVEEEHFFQILHDVRDTLLDRTGWLHILIGPTGIRNSLGSNRNHRRISEKITGTVIKLAPHSLRDVHRILEKRVECFRLSSNKKAPVPHEVINTLYKASGGEIRYILNRASDIAGIVARDIPESTEIEKDLAYAALHRIVAEEISSLGLTDRQQNFLKKLTEIGSAQSRDFKDYDLKSAQSMSAYLVKFHDRSLLELTRSGKQRIYTPRGDVALFFRGTDSLL